MQVLASLMMSSTLLIVILKHTSAHADDSRTRDTEHLDVGISAIPSVCGDCEDQRPLHTSNAFPQSRTRAENLRRGHELSFLWPLALTRDKSLRH